MTQAVSIDKCRGFVASQARTATAAGQDHARKLALTVSRQTGTGGLVIAHKVAELLQAHSPSQPPPWKVFDKAIVDKVVEMHGLPKDMARFMSEDGVSKVTDTVEELLGLHPAASTLVQRTGETMLQLASIGNVVLVGRGGNLVTARLPHVLHVRLVGSLERRIARLAHFDRISEEEARDRIAKSDRGRARYVHDHYSRDIDDPLLYDLVLSTDRLSDDVAACIIAHAAVMRGGEATHTHGRATPGPTPAPASPGP